MGKADTRSVDVAAPYPFHLHQAARELDERHALRMLLTCYPSRYVRGVPATRVSSRPVVAVVRRAFAGSRFDPRLNRIVLGDFGRWAAARSRGDIVLASAGLATDVLRAARARGAVVVTDRGSWHVLDQQRVLYEEADRIGWPRPHFDPWLIDRELEEYETSSLILVPSTEALRSFTRRGISESRMRRVPYGIDLVQFHPGMERDEKRIICVGAVGLQKGHHNLLEAYRAARRPGSSLVLVGPCDRPAAERLAVSEADIALIGPVPRAEVATQLRSSGIFVLASLQEGMALVLPQAMASGLAVIATSATGAQDLITDGVEGFIIEPGDVGALSEAIESLLDDPVRSASMGCAARRRAMELGGWSAYGDSLLRALQSVA